MKVDSKKKKDIEIELKIKRLLVSKELAQNNEITDKGLMVDWGSKIIEIGVLFYRIVRSPSNKDDKHIEIYKIFINFTGEYIPTYCHLDYNNLHILTSNQLNRHYIKIICECIYGKLIMKLYFLDCSLPIKYRLNQLRLCNERIQTLSIAFQRLLMK